MKENKHSYEIRTLQESDIPAVIQFVEQCDNLVLERASVYWMLARFFADTCFVAVRDEKIIGLLFGFISQTDSKIAYIQKLGTRADQRKKGVATALVGIFENTVAKKNVQKIFLTTYPDAANQTAIAFYEQRGFVGEKFWKGTKERLGLWKGIS